MSEAATPQPDSPAAASEVVVARFQPAPRSILVRSFRTSVIAAVLTLGLLLGASLAKSWLAPHLPASTDLRSLAIGLGVAIILTKLAYEALLQASRRYTLTSARLVSTSGIFHRTSVEIPLRNVQQVVLDRTLLERLAGLGTIGVTSAGSQMIDLAWVMVARPGERLAQVRGALDAVAIPVRLVDKPCVRLVATPPESSARAGRRERREDANAGVPIARAAQPASTTPPQAIAVPTDPSRPLILGLAGGIGAGKSEVARLLAERGALVTDSDQEAKAALDRPEVRGELVRWWGPEILNTEGRVDRKAVARIIFADAAQRLRLEALVHPLVKATRAQLVDRAKGQGVRLVVIDAPLLFEAGLDAECDAVLFVDAPREQRLARVQATRGWDEAELDRREKAQIPLDEKRRRSDEVILNTGDVGALRQGVAAFHDRLMSARS